MYFILLISELELRRKIIKCIEKLPPCFLVLHNYLCLCTLVLREWVGVCMCVHAVQNKNLVR